MVDIPYSYHAWMIFETVLSGSCQSQSTPEENDYRAYVGQVFVHKERERAIRMREICNIFVRISSVLRSYERLLDINIEYYILDTVYHASYIIYQISYIYISIYYISHDIIIYYT